MTIANARTLGETANLRLEFGNEGTLDLLCRKQDKHGIENYAIRFPFGWIKVDENEVISAAPA
jgi:hypothetical protein